MRPKKPPLRARDLLAATSVTTSAAAKILAREPDDPITRALKLWGDDENPFKELITSESEDARIWRETVELIFKRLRPNLRLGTVWRGWYFESDRARDEVMAAIERTGVFTNSRVGISMTRSRRVACRPEFLNEHGALWEIRRPKSARNLESIFRAIGAKYPQQREVIFPSGARFVMVEPARWCRILRSGQELKVRQLVFQEQP